MTKQNDSPIVRLLKSKRADIEFICESTYREILYDHGVWQVWEDRQGVVYKGKSEAKAVRALLGGGGVNE